MPELSYNAQERIARQLESIEGRFEELSIRITLPEVNAYTLGQLMYFFEMQTAYAGELLDIDAFNQPGVEESKVAAFAMLGRDTEKHNAKREEMKNRPERKAEYIL